MMSRWSGSSEDLRKGHLMAGFVLEPPVKSFLRSDSGVWFVKIASCLYQKLRSD